MHNTVVNHSEGCRISPQPHLSRGALYSSDSMQSVHFPPAELIEYERQRHFTRKLLGHLERGVLVRANQEGIFIKRLCQSRVFWTGLTEVGQHYSPMPCKLERDAVVKIFDTGRFLQGAFVCSIRRPNASRERRLGRLKTFCFLFASSSSAAVPGGSGSCSGPLGDLVFRRGAPRSQQRQEQADHRAGETPQPAAPQLFCIANKALREPACPPPQISVLNCQHLLEAVNVRRSQPYCSNPSLDVSDSAAAEQLAHIYQDLCSYSVPQRSACSRDYVPITA